MHRVKSKAGAFGGITITAIGAEQAIEKARELADGHGLDEILIIDPKGDTLDAEAFEKRFLAQRSQEGSSNT